MTPETRTPGHVPSLPHDLTSFTGRLTAFCAWMGLPVPFLERDDGGEVMMTDALLDWVFAEGASLHWLICGDPKAMAAVFRREELRAREAIQSTRHLDRAETAALTAVLQIMMTEGFDLEQAVTLWRDAVRERRTSLRLRNGPRPTWDA